MITGARQGTLSGLRRLVAFAMAHDLGVYLIPGPEIARFHKLDIAATGMRIVASPRHASVLLVVGEIPPVLREAVAVIYAQMMRPRVLFVMENSPGSTELSPLPAADIKTGISQQALIKGVSQVRTALATSAFQTDISEFDAPILQIRIEYTCSMHPEIVRDEPGSCPKCGMDLIRREVQATVGHAHTEDQNMESDDHAGMDHDAATEYTCSMHPEISESEPGSCPKCGMTLVPRDAQAGSGHEHHDMDHDTAVDYTCSMHSEISEKEPGSCPKCGMTLVPREIATEYTCPMHPEVAEKEPGSCPECGMNLEPRQVEAMQSHDHSGMDHGDMDHDAATEYTCSMHPEISEKEPGSCPKCGMTLTPREIVVEYTCSMHPEVVQDEPGSCPKCGMTLVPREIATEYTCPMHPEVAEKEPGSCPECGMTLVPRDAQAEPKQSHEHAGMDHSTMDHDAATEYTCSMHPEISEKEPGSCPKCGMTLVPRDVAVEYTCPMHPEVTEKEPGSCPECGMNLEPRQAEAMQSHDHSGMDHGEAFMSMIDVTKDLPRSGDGLAMDWIDVPFGPFFPGLPGGLLLTLTLDGDTVAGASAESLVGNQPLLLEPKMDINNFSNRLANLAPLTPISYQVLACLAIENAVGLKVDPQFAQARVVAVERERIVSHLGWLVLFAEQTGFAWLQHRATSLQREFLQGDIKQNQVSELKSAMIALNKRLQRTPLLKSRTMGIGKLNGNTDITLLGPVARASGINNDARSNEKIYRELGFTPASGKDGDARARLQLRLDEISQSLTLIEKTSYTTNAEIFNISGIGENSGTGEAVIETPRGLARLQLTLEKGQVITAQLETPSTRHLDLIEQLTAQQELGDALVTVGSLDLSPWEIRL